MQHAQRLLAAALCVVLAACGQEPPPAPRADARAVSGAVMKGAVQGATVEFYNLDAAGNPTTLVGSVTTDADGRFTAALPGGDAHLLARTFGGSYADESDPATGAARRRIALPAAPTAGFESVLPPGVTSFAITPYTHALLIKARLQAAGLNFFNVFDAVRLQATQAFGFDPVTTLPAEPLAPAATATQAARQYALLLGAASQAINAIATAAGRLPDFTDVMLFIDDLGSDGTFNLVSIAEQLRRFRNNNLALYAGVPLPVLNETLLSQPADVPNAAPVANGDAVLVVEGGSVSVLDDGSTTSVLANDTDAEGSALSAVPASAPAHGSLTLNTDGTFSYTHDGSEFASDSFTYRASDGTDASAPATVSITVSAVNDAPVATDDPGYTGAVGGTVTAIAGAGGVRDNDTDPDGPVTDLTTTPVSGPSFAASFTLSADGGFTYTHDGSANLVDSFTYEVCDAGVPALCDTAVATITLSSGAGAVVLPYLTNAGELKLFDPADPANPILVESGLPTVGFTWRTLMKASVAGGVASNITPARLVYIGASGTVRMVNLEAGQARTPVQVSSIADACRINGIAEDFANPDNSIVRIDTAGDNGQCEGGSGDDFATAEAWLVPLGTAATSPGVPIGLGYCCGIAGIGTASGALTGVLVAEDDGTGGTYFLRRRDIGSLATPAFSMDLEIAGTGFIYGTLPRGLGDQHIYVRAVRFGIDTTYKVLRFNVGTNTLTAVYDYGVSDGSLFGESFDHAAGYDATNVYFTKPDGSELLAVPHTASTTTQFSSLFTPSPGTKINAFEQAGTRIAIEASSADGTLGGVYSVLKAGGGQLPLAFNGAAPSTTRLRGTNGSLVFMDTMAGTASPVYTASAVTADGASGTGDITDAQWAGETFQATCDFNLGCEQSVAASAVYLRRLASTSEAQFELADPLTGAPTGTYVGSVFNVFTGPAAFVFGFGQYGQITAFAQIGQTDLFLADSAQASATPPATALATVANLPGGDNLWLLFGDGEPAGGGAATDSDLDGLTDDQEAALGTDPFNADTDFDGLSDFDEVLVDGDPNTYQAGVDTDPNNPDTDGDGVGDGTESGVGSSPLSANIVRFVDPTATCGGGCDGLSWATAFINDSSVEGASNISGSGTGSEAYVLFAPGTYGSLDLTGVDRQHVVYIGSLGPGVYIPAFPPTTIFNAGAGSRVLHATQVTAVAVANIRFENGLDAALGGGVLVEAPLHTTFGANTLRLERVEVAGNVSGESGGGVVAFGSGNFLDIDASAITGNQAQGAAGAAVQGGGVLALNGAQVTVANSIIGGNSVSCAAAGCTALGGGAAASGVGALLDISGSTVENNSAFTGTGNAAGGGGLSADASALLLVGTTDVRGNSASGASVATGAGGGIAGIGADLFIADSKIRDNAASAQLITPPFGGGGGIYGESGATLDLQRSIIAANKAPAGPGGGVNLVGTGSVTVQDSKFLSNGSLNPGGGLHVHPLGLTSVFNNLFVGNATTDTAAEGGAAELDIESGDPGLSFDSNTVAYNQTTASSGTGGGLSVKSSVPASFDLHNNNIWFNQDSTPATPNPGDNYLQAGPLALASSGNNVDEASLTAGNLSPLDPLFVQGFYLDPVAPSPSIDAGDNTFAGPIISPPYTTDPAGTADSVAPAVDIGFHHVEASAGAFGSVVPVFTGLPFVCVDAGGPRDVTFRPIYSAAAGGQAGHLIVVEFSNATLGTAISSLTSLDPHANGSRIATDFGDGTYGITVQTTGAPGTANFTIFADEQAPRTLSVDFQTACS